MRFRKFTLVYEDDPIVVSNTTVSAITPRTGKTGAILWIAGVQYGVQEDFDDVVRWWTKDGEFT